MALRFLAGAIGWRFALLLPPGLGLDVEGVAVLDKAVDERGYARGPWEDGAPLLEWQV